MSKTKTELTDELALEAYNELYIGQSLSRNGCAEVLAVRPDELEKRWEALKLRQRNRKEAMRAKGQAGKLWEWTAAEAALDTLVGDAAEPDTLAAALDLAIPDPDPAKPYANGHAPTAPTPAAELIDFLAEKEADPGPGRRAIQINKPADAQPPLQPGETVAFQVKEGVVYDVERKPEAVPDYLGETIEQLYPRQIARRLNMILREEFDGAAAVTVESITFSVKVTVPVRKI